MKKKQVRRGGGGLHRVRSTHGIFTGKLPDGRQVILGPFVPIGVCYIFGKDGKLLEMLTKRAKGARVSAEMVDALVRDWLASLSMTEGPVDVLEFHDPKLGIAITDLPQFLRDFSWAEGQERQALEEDRDRWRSRGYCVFHWADDYHLDSDGNVIST
jgi:hypothetical protein